MRTTVQYHKRLPLMLLLLAATGCVQVGMLVGRLMTETTGDLTPTALQVMFIRGTEPVEADTATIAALGAKDWRSNGNAIAVSVFKRAGIGFVRIDGDVKIDGKVATYWGNGSYGVWVDKVEDRAYPVQILPSKSPALALQVRPPTGLRVVKVNGLAEGGIVDQAKPLELELELDPASQGKLLRVAMLKRISLGLRDFQDLTITRAAPKVTVPAAAFRHSLNPILGFIEGDNFLLVEAFDVTRVTPKGIGAAQIIATARSVVPVKVQGSAEAVLTARAEGKVEVGPTPIAFALQCDAAITSPPVRSKSKVAIASIVVRGTLYKQESEESQSKSVEHKDGALWEVTRTYRATTTWQFPQLSDAQWDATLRTLHDQVAAAVQAMGHEVVSIDKAVQAHSYSTLEAVEDTNTDVRVSRSLAGSRPQIATSLSGLWKQAGTTFASDTPSARIMREIGADALLDVILDLEVGDMDGKIVLRPKMTVRMTGAPNGYHLSSVYFGGQLVGGGGSPATETVSSPEALDRMTRVRDLGMAFARALEALAAKQAPLGYEAIWAGRF